MFATVGNADTALDELVELRRTLIQLEHLFLEKVAAYDAAHEAQADGYLSTAVALRTECRMSAGEARGHVDLARKLRSLPLTSRAMADGAISRHHAAIIAKAYTPERADAIRELEPTFVTNAKRMQPRELAAAVQYATDAIDGDGGSSRDQHERSLRRLHLSPTLDGVGMLDGRLDPETNEIVGTALHAEMERDRIADDPRTPAQRRVDALRNICQRALDNGELGSTRRVRPHVSVVVHVQDNGTVDAKTAFGVRLSEASLGRIFCDCELSRVLVRGTSEVLDVGRATRTVSVAQWKALVARDGHCQHPGCDRPPTFCEAHHIVYWENDGPTDLANLKLLCWEHHHAIHRDDHRRRKRAP